MRHPIWLAAAVVLAAGALVPGTSAAQTGGPDVFGYEYAPGTYDFVTLDPAAGGPGVLLENGSGSELVTLPFPFIYYGVTYTEVLVDDEPGVAMGDRTGALTTANTSFPATSTAAPDLAVFWDGISATSSANIWGWDDVASDRYILSWEGHAVSGGSEGGAWQVHLYADHRIEFHYADTNFGAGVAGNNGGTATIGIQDRAGGTHTAGNFLEWSVNTPAIVDGSAIEFALCADADGDGWPSGCGAEQDCADNNASVNPGAVELCDGLDTDCDATTSETVDGDGDGQTACGGDCDDTNATVLTGAAELCDGLDTNCDGTIANNELVDGDGDGSLLCADCDDGNTSVYPGANEICDSIDNDCDALIDDADTNVVGAPTWYTDSDGDSFGDPATAVDLCVQPAGGVSDNNDCDDFNAAIYPNAPETCDGVDSDCDGFSDNQDLDVGAILDTPTILSTGVGAPIGTASNSVTIGGTSNPIVDVNVTVDVDHSWDGDVSITLVAPSGASVDLSSDNGGSGDDYDGTVFDDEALTPITSGSPPFSGSFQPEQPLSTLDGGSANGTWTLTVATNGLGSGTFNTWTLEVVTGSTADGDGDSWLSAAGCGLGTPDCDDGDATINPGATEICNGVDDDCSGSVPANEADADGDGVAICDGDCDDTNPSVRPGVAEACDGVDTNCDGAILSTEQDVDGDGALACADDCDDTDPAIGPSQPEICDGVDTNCDGALLAAELTDGDADGAVTCLDCDDADPGAFPGAPEVCNAVDDDCNNTVDDLKSVVGGAAGGTITNTAPLLATATVPFSDPIVDLDVAIDITHTWDNDLDVTLTSPAGTTIELFTDVGGQDDNFTGTVLDDEAAISIVNGTAPFTGSFQPEGSLAAVDGQNPAGTWTLEIVDDAQGDDGVLNSWSLVFNEPTGDSDGDGFYACNDCDDTLATVFPGATELCDGLDGDCDGVLPADESDGDGDGVTGCGGDCDDSDPSILPGAPELCGDGVDQDCDGSDLACSGGAGDIVINEVFANPGLVSDALGEWIELFNPTSGDVSVAGWTIAGMAGGDFIIDVPLVVPAGDFVVLGASDNQGINGGAPVDWAWPSGRALSNSSAILLELLSGATLVDGIDTGAAAMPAVTSGASLSLDPDLADATDNDDGASWNLATSSYGLGDLGTPGATNDSACVGADSTGDFDGDGDCDDVDLDDDADGDPDTTDCDDADDTVYTGAPEGCDGIDTDCDGAPATDELDADGDGMEPCNGDCDDADPLTYDGAAELCDDIDQDCDGDVAEAFADLDGDGLPNCGDPDADDDGETFDTDCDDLDDTIYTGAPETCDDGIDSDCDGLDAPDLDGDGSTVCDDCDDDDDTSYPGAPEECDAVDHDCDGDPFNGAGQTDWFADIDGDGYGDPEAPHPDNPLCLPPDDYIDNDGDCDDADPDVNPEGVEVCDGVDNDCDPDTVPDGGDADADGDGWFTCVESDGAKVDCDDTNADVSPDAPELCDTETDEDCDGSEAIIDDDPECWEPGCGGSVAGARGATGGLALLLLGGLLVRRRRRLRVPAVVLVAALALPLTAQAGMKEEAKRQMEFAAEELANKRFDRALKSAESALRLCPDCLDAMVLKAAAYLGLGERKLARDVMLAYVEEVGESALSLEAQELYEKLVRRRERPGAARAGASAAASDEDPDVFRERVAEALEAKRCRAARSAASELVRLLPDDPSAWTLVGDAARCSDALREAVLAFRKHVELGGTDQRVVQLLDAMAKQLGAVEVSFDTPKGVSSMTLLLDTGEEFIESAPTREGVVFVDIAPGRPLVLSVVGTGLRAEEIKVKPLRAAETRRMTVRPVVVGFGTISVLPYKLDRIQASIAGPEGVVAARPGANMELTVGEYVARVESENGMVQIPIEVTRGGLQTFDANEHQPSAITVTGLPAGANVRVFVEGLGGAVAEQQFRVPIGDAVLHETGVLVAPAQKVRNLRPGRGGLFVEHPTLGQGSSEFTLTAGGEQKTEFDWKAMPGLAEVTTMFAAYQEAASASQGGKGKTAALGAASGALIAAGVAMFVVGGVTGTRMATIRQDAIAASDVGDAEALQAAANAYKGQTSLRTAMFVGGSVSAGLGVLGLSLTIATAGKGKSTIGPWDPANPPELPE